MVLRRSQDLLDRILVLLPFRIPARRYQPASRHVHMGHSNPNADCIPLHNKKMYAGSNVYADTYDDLLLLYEPDEYAAPPLLRKYGLQGL